MPNNFLFVDIETTGLDEYNDQILEIYATFTNEDFAPIGEPFHSIHSFYNIEKFNSTIVKMHGSNNLFIECNREGHEHETIDGMFREYIGDSEQIIVAGSGVHFDRRWLLHWYPWLKDNLHYRIFDLRALDYVTPFRLKPTLPHPSSHRAKPDVLNALYTAGYYKQLLHDAA